MKPERYEPWTADRHRLTGYLESRGTNLGLPAAGKFIFGTLCVAAGVWFTLVGTGSVSVSLSSLHAPHWVVVAAGMSFALVGLLAWGMAWGQFAANRDRKRAIREHPNEPALQDYPWHPVGFTLSQWRGMGKVSGLALGITIFLSMFNWWAFGTPQDWMLKAIVLGLDAIGLAMWWQMAVKLARALKFGASKVVFTRFPFRVGEPVVLRWRPGAGIHRVCKGWFKLRCVEEWLEWTGHAGHRSRKLVQEEIWTGTWILEQPRTLGLKDEVELRYEIPAAASATRLSGAKPVFWELEVKLELQGVDFKGTYLVPIYGPEKEAEYAAGGRAAAAGTAA